MLWTYAAQRGYTVLIDDEDFVSGAAADAAEGHPGVVHLVENAPVGDVVRALRRIGQFASTDELRVTRCIFPAIGSKISPYLSFNGCPSLVYIQHGKIYYGRTQMLVNMEITVTLYH